MIKRMLVLLLVIAFVLGMAACGKTKIVHCDRCDAEIEVKADSNVEEDWIVFCADCEKEVGPIVEAD